LGDEVAGVESRGDANRPVVGIGIFTYCNIEMWTPLQQWYWVQYLDTKTFPKERRDYKLLTKMDAHGKQLMAVDADVVPGPMQGWPLFPFALTPKARQTGAVALKVDTVHYTSAQMNQMLSERVYNGQTPDDLIRPAWVGALVVLVRRAGARTDTCHRATPSPMPQRRGRTKAQGSADGHGERIQ
jgi:hypothetical protein